MKIWLVVATALAFGAERELAQPCKQPMRRHHGPMASQRRCRLELHPRSRTPSRCWTMSRCTPCPGRNSRSPARRSPIAMVRPTGSQRTIRRCRRSSRRARFRAATGLCLQPVPLSKRQGSSGERQHYRPHLRIFRAADVGFPQRRQENVRSKKGQYGPHDALCQDDDGRRDQGRRTLLHSDPRHALDHGGRSATVPKTKPQNGMFLTLEGEEAGVEPIGERIIETPEKTHDTSSCATRDQASSHMCRLAASRRARLWS